MGKQVTPEQREMMLVFVENHPELIDSKFSQKLTHSDVERSWSELTKKLNSSNLGPSKTMGGWKTVCLNWCCMHLNNVINCVFFFCYSAGRTTRFMSKRRDINL
jgi:hypothetical protein